MTPGSSKSAHKSSQQNSRPPLALKRNVGLALFVFYGVGNILGAGIYVITGKVAGMAGYYAPLGFLLAGVVAALSALAYSEISVRFPISAGEAQYVQEALKSRALSIFCGLSIAFAGIISAAAIIRGFSAYAMILIDLPAVVLITGTTLTLAAAAAWGIKESTLMVALITIVEIGGLLILLIAGAPFLAELPARLEEHYLPSELSLWPGILLGAFTAFYAFIGFEDMVNIAEEIKNPRRNLPLGILISLAIASILYIGVSYVAVAAMEPAKLAATESPLADLFTRLTGYPKSWFGPIASLAVINGALIQIIMSSRILYGMSQMKFIPAAFKKINKKTRTPLFATLVTSGLVLALASGTATITLARITSFIILIVFFLVHLSLFVLRRRDPLWKTKGVSFPAAIPIMGMVASLFFLGVEILY